MITPENLTIFYASSHCEPHVNCFLPNNLGNLCNRICAYQDIYFFHTFFKTISIYNTVRECCKSTAKIIAVFMRLIFKMPNIGR